jgi:glycosyltransferase involved in cell wall biosynthesis
MKLLVLTSQVFLLGGAEKLSLELYYGLNKTRQRVDFGIVFKSPNLGYTNACISKSLEIKRGNWFSLDVPINPSLINVSIGIFRLIKLIRNRKYTHIESSVVTPSIIATVACIFTGCKHIVGFHQTYQPFFALDSKFKLFFLLSRIATCNYYYGISDYVVRSWINSRKMKLKSIKTIYNSYNDNFDIIKVKSEKNSVFGCDKLIILCVGRITKFKGYQILFDAIKNELKSNNIALYFLGSPDKQTVDDQEEFDRVSREIIFLGLQNHVFFLGFKENIIPYLASCDLVVHPTKFEGFGLVLVEAMLLKKPIITTDVEAIPEILYGTGIIQLPFGNINALKEEIIKFLNNPEIYNSIIERGFQRATQFNSTNRVNKIAEYCKSI